MSDILIRDVDELAIDKIDKAAKKQRCHASLFKIIA